MSTISASTTSTTAFKVTSDTTGTLVFQTGAVPTTAISIDASQAVGIGTSSPGYKLTVAGASGSAVLNLLESGVRSWGVRAGGTATNTFDIADFTAGATRLTIDSSGNLGIGTSSPLGKLQIKTQTNGNAAFVNSTSVSGGVKINCFNDAGSASSPFELDGSTLQFNIGAVEKMRLDSSGNLGIGTSSPLRRLAIAGDAQVYNTAADGASNTVIGRLTSQVRNYGTNIATASFASIEFATGTWPTGNIRFLTNGTDGTDGAGTERMRLDSSGNLGLGVTPSAWGSGLKALQVGANSYASLFDFNNGVSALSSNLFWTGSAYSRISASSRWSFAYFQDTTNGAHSWLTSTAAGTSTPTMSTLMTLDASGNLGIGTTSPAGRLDIRASGAVQQYIISTSATSQENVIVSLANNGTVYSSMNFDSADYKFKTSGTERARITSGGNLFVGCTAVPSASVQGFCITGTSSGNLSSSGTSTAAYNHFLFLNGNGTVGSISTSGSTTTYSTSSDYRLKNTIAPMTGALAKVALLKPCTYKWNADGSDGQGFIAHELAEVVPQCVTGEKDAVDAEGKPRYQGVDTSFLVATLTAAIQELTARVAALEGNN